MEQPHWRQIESAFDSRESILSIEDGSQNIEATSSEAVQIDLGRLIRKYILLAALLVPLGAIGGFMSVALTPAVFKAEALIQVQPINGSILKMQNVEDFGHEDVDLSTEALILRSNTFSQRVLERMQLEGLTPTPERSDIFSKLRRILKRPDDNGVTVDLGINGLKAGPTPKPVAMALKTLDVHPVERTRILEISCDSTNPTFAADFINALSDEYIQHNNQSRMETLKSNTDWVSGELEKTRAKMAEAERRLQEFSRTPSNLFVTQESALAQGNLREIQMKLSLAQTDLITKKARYETVMKSAPDALPDLLGDAVIKQYQTQIADFRRQEAALTATLLPEHPKVKKIEAQISELQATLQKEINAALKRITSDYEAAVRDQELLKKSYDSAAQQITGQASKETQYEALKKEYESARQSYNSLLTQANEASIVGSVPTNNIQIIDKAVPPQRPYKPKPPVNIAGGAAAGLMLCCGIALLRERLDQRVSSPLHARQLLNLPQLGVIPSAQRDEKRAWPFLPMISRTPVESGSLIRLNDGGAGSRPQALSIQQTLLAESFRTTLASLLRESVGRRPRVILVTSPGPGEGKTTITSNLGIALAETGQKVLILDADFRRPRAHKIFGLSNGRGLSDLLTEEIPISEYAKVAFGIPTSVPNLLLLPNGTRAENIAKVLYSIRFRQLVQRLKVEFDTILIDVPPLLPVADARVISDVTDGIILVLRVGVTDKNSAMEALEQLRVNRSVILGTVLNDWKLSKSRGKASYYYAAPDSHES